MVSISAFGSEGRRFESTKGYTPDRDMCASLLVRVAPHCKPSPGQAPPPITRIQMVVLILVVLCDIALTCEKADVSVSAVQIIDRVTDDYVLCVKDQLWL